MPSRTTSCAPAPTASRPSSPPARRSTTSWCRPSRPCARLPSARSASATSTSAHRRHGAARGRHRRDEDRRGQDLVATLPVYLNALAGKGVHVVTVNDYLARRDAEWMGQIYRFLGLSVGVIVHGLDDAERAAAYACDITYGTNNEYGFDYLRDNMKYELAQMVQRGHHFAIVDEVDSILVDEARTPLIISGPIDDRSDLYIAIDALSRGSTRATTTSTRSSARSSLTESRQREDRGASARGGPAQGGRPLRRGQRHASSTTSTRLCAPTRCSSATRTTSSATARW